MYNTDRITIIEEDVENVDNNIILHDYDGTEKGKEWARGYGTYRPRTIYNMGTDNGKHPWDIRVFWKIFIEVFHGYEDINWYRAGNKHPAHGRDAEGVK